MMHFPSVYIIVLNFNRKDDTLECLRSLYTTGYPNFRVMVVDNGSTDGSAAAVRDKFPDAEVIETGANLMYAGGNNVGIKLALKKGADYVLLINNDTVVSPTLVPELVTAMEAEPAAGLAGPMIYYYPPKQGGRETIWYAGGVLELWKGLIAHRGIRQADEGQFGDVCETGYVTGCCVLARRACLEKTGLLDPSYTLYAEDADLSLRARKAGYKLLFVPKAVMWHKVSISSGGEFSPLKMRRKAASLSLLFRRHARPWHWLTAPLFVLGRAALFPFLRLPPLIHHRRG